MAKELQVSAQLVREGRKKPAKRKKTYYILGPLGARLCRKSRHAMIRLPTAALLVKKMRDYRRAAIVRGRGRERSPLLCISSMKKQGKRGWGNKEGGDHEYGGTDARGQPSWRKRGNKRNGSGLGPHTSLVCMEGKRTSPGREEQKNPRSSFRVECKKRTLNIPHSTANHGGKEGNEREVTASPVKTR